MKCQFRRSRDVLVDFTRSSGSRAERTSISKLNVQNLSETSQTIFWGGGCRNLSYKSSLLLSGEDWNLPACCWWNVCVYNTAHLEAFGSFHPGFGALLDVRLQPRWAALVSWVPLALVPQVYGQCLVLLHTLLPPDTHWEPCAGVHRDWSWPCSTSSAAWAQICRKITSRLHSWRFYLSLQRSLPVPGSRKEFFPLEQSRIKGEGCCQIWNACRI